MLPDGNRGCCSPRYSNCSVLPRDRQRRVGPSLPYSGSPCPAPAAPLPAHQVWAADSQATPSHISWLINFRYVGNYSWLGNLWQSCSLCLRIYKMLKCHNRAMKIKHGNGCAWHREQSRTSPSYLCVCYVHVCGISVYLGVLEVDSGTDTGPFCACYKLNNE